MIYEFDPLTQASTYFLKEVNNASQKVTAIPLPWGAKCYGVTALAGGQESEMTTYCPGQPPPATKKITVTPIDWLTTGGQWMQDGDCDTYGGADAYLLANQSGFGSQAGEVLVGSYLVDDDEEDCYREGNYSGGVEFNLGLSGLPPNAVIQKAVLKFSKVFMDYGATGLAAPKPASCVASVGKAKQGWSGLNSGNHFSSKHIGASTPIVSLSAYMSPQADVTSAVNAWIKNPENNHGFILTPVSAPHPLDDGNGECLSGLGNFQLDIYYFAP